ncbi:transcription factor e(y)2-domain-containing protein [Geopyxis carbonaria]|nr:transcription factor e(y)2-domain-containing protein [Geopyxis carbonaria]
MSSPRQASRRSSRRTRPPASTSSDTHSTRAMTDPTPPAPADSTRTEINRRLLESGDLAKLESELLALLQAAGWTETLGDSCRTKLRDPEKPATNFAELLKAVGGAARKEVPREVKAEIVRRIRDLVKKMVV